MAELVAARSEATRADDRAVGLWLICVCALIFAMSVIGAITRLTESGLSIMEWAPVTGVLPPMSEAEWRRLFALYQQIPEYRLVNAGMSLDEFKSIFWWEWIHRFWGRLIGVVFLAGFLWLLLRGRLRRALVPHLVVLFALGGVQGGVGWFMVASGFADRVDVSQYRLMLHLGLALAIYAYAFWLAAQLLAPPAAMAAREAASARVMLWAFIVLLALTILAGALVAGLNAGLAYNTFPLMDGRLVPSGYGAREPWLDNWFENPAAVQFNHRLLTVATTLGALGLWLRARRLAPAARRAFDLLAMGAMGQLILGIATLLAVVPVWLGALHQGGAVVVLTLTVWALTRLRPAVGGTAP